jgi:hypothetical protein
VVFNHEEASVCGVRVRVLLFYCDNRDKNNLYFHHPGVVMAARRFCLWIALAAASALAGCVTDQAQAPPPVAPVSAPVAPPVPPKPAVAYFKEGASEEEFQRTKAACIMKYEMAAGAASDEFGPNWGLGLSVFGSCMRSQGWVLRLKA